jgi:hypothetical protein
MAFMPLPCALLIDDHAMFRAGLRLVIKVAIPELGIFEAGSVDEEPTVQAIAEKIQSAPVVDSGELGLRVDARLQWLICDCVDGPRRASNGHLR